MSVPIHLGISTCPNDTFAFCALLENRVDRRGLDFHIELQDVEALNMRLLAGEFDVAKASFHAALLLSAECGVLPVGSALGFGVGPLLLAARPQTDPAEAMSDANGKPREPLILCPGEHTTATLLYQIFHAGEGQLRQAVFSEIMPALQQGQADFGVCIHEGRFTWQEQGLSLVEDLGQRWEATTAAPLPLGGILARHRLGETHLSTVAQVIRDSLDAALANPQQALPTMRRYAQEFSDKVLMAHVELYVNGWTQELGHEGTAALAELRLRAIEAGVLDGDAAELEVVGSVD